MKYPRFLKKDDIIGITALSKGCSDVIKEAKRSLNHLKEDYKLIITPNVYGSGVVSSSKEERINEFNELLDEDIKFLFNIRGGDFLYETLDGLNYHKIVKKNIWVEGYSDITSLLYLLTIKYDLATIYGLNGKSFDSEELELYQKNNLEIIKGNLIKQVSFNTDSISLNGEFESCGILIGGCLDALRYLFGTEYDKTKDFLEKYKKYKIIWYFDIFSMSTVDVYLTLLQMKKMGYFQYSDTFLVGKVMFPKIEGELSYEDALRRVFDKNNIIYDACIGHVKPVFTLINGSLGKIGYQKNKMTLEMELINENNS